MATPTKEDHVAIGGGQLPDFFQKRPIASGLLKAFLRPYNKLENLLFEMLMFRGIYNAVGFQLDVLGDLFGVSRQNRPDNEYRGAILRRIAIQRSDGTTERFLQGLRTITGASYVDFFEHFSAHSIVWLGEGYGQGTLQSVKDISPVGVTIEVGIDNRFDSFVPAEGESIVADLQSHLEEDYQVVDNFGIVRDLQVQTAVPSFQEDARSLLAERADILGETPENTLDPFSPLLERLQNDVLFSVSEILSLDNPELEALYLFDEEVTFPLVRDQSPRGRDLILPRTWQLSPSVRDGTPALDTSTDLTSRVFIPNSAELLGVGSTPFTIMGEFFFQETLPPTNIVGILSTFNFENIGAGLAGSGGWALVDSPYIVNGSTIHELRLEAFTDTLEFVESSTFSLPSNTPIFVVVTYNGSSKLTLYINMFEAARINMPELGYSGFSPSTNNLALGADPEPAFIGTPSSANFQLDNMRILSRELSLFEIMAITPYEETLSELQQEI